MTGDRSKSFVAKTALDSGASDAIHSVGGDHDQLASTGVILGRGKELQGRQEAEVTDTPDRATEEQTADDIGARQKWPGERKACATGGSVTQVCCHPGGLKRSVP